MRQRDLKFFRQLLEERKRDILEEAERAVGTMNTEPRKPAPTRPTAPRSNPTEPFCCGCAIASANCSSKIDEAFARIDDGIYGQCEECDGEIGIERLKARPVTTLCIACKSAQEARERQGSARNRAVAARHIDAASSPGIPDYPRIIL